jgi:hypothetical protein
MIVRFGVVSWINSSKSRGKKWPSSRVENLAKFTSERVGP